MGNSIESKGYTVEIQLNRLDKVYFEGELATGFAHISNSNNVTYNLNGIYLAIRCKVTYNKVIEDTNMRLKRRQEYRGILYEKKMILCEDYTVKSGEQKLPFSFLVQGLLPPSLTHNRSVEVKYVLRISIALQRLFYTTYINVINTPIVVIPKVYPISNIADHKYYPIIKEAIQEMDTLNNFKTMVKPVESKNRRSHISSSPSSASLSKYEDDRIDQRYRCELTVPLNSVGVQQMIPYSVTLHRQKASTSAQMFDLTTNSNTAPICLKIRLVQCVIVNSNLYRKTMLSHNVAVPLKKDYDNLHSDLSAGLDGTVNFHLSTDDNTDDGWTFTHNGTFCLSSCVTPPSFHHPPHNHHYHNKDETISTTSSTGLSVFYVITCTLRELTVEMSTTQLHHSVGCLPSNDKLPPRQESSGSLSNQSNSSLSCLSGRENESNNSQSSRDESQQNHHLQQQQQQQKLIHQSKLVALAPIFVHNSEAILAHPYKL